MESHDYVCVKCLRKIGDGYHYIFDEIGQGLKLPILLSRFFGLDLKPKKHKYEKLCIVCCNEVLSKRCFLTKLENQQNNFKEKKATNNFEIKQTYIQTNDIQIKNENNSDSDDDIENAELNVKDELGIQNNSIIPKEVNSPSENISDHSSNSSSFFDSGSSVYEYADGSTEDSNRSPSKISNEVNDSSQKINKRGKKLTEQSDDNSHTSMSENMRKKKLSILSKTLNFPPNIEVKYVNGGYGIANPFENVFSSQTNELLEKSLIKNDNEFKCLKCGKKFHLIRLLRRHIKCHTQYKKFLCIICGKGFNDTFDLKRHTRVHTGVRPFKCNNCERSFTQRCSLETHCLKVHNLQFQFPYNQRREKTYVCEECGHTTENAEDHCLHLLQKHPNSDSLKKLHDKRHFNFKDFKLALHLKNVNMFKRKQLSSINSLAEDSLVKIPCKISHTTPSTQKFFIKPRPIEDLIDTESKSKLNPIIYDQNENINLIPNFELPKLNSNAKLPILFSATSATFVPNKTNPFAKPQLPETSMKYVPNELLAKQPLSNSTTICSDKKPLPRKINLKPTLNKESNISCQLTSNANDSNSKSLIKKIDLKTKNLISGRKDRNVEDNLKVEPPPNISKIPAMLDHDYNKKPENEFNFRQNFKLFSPLSFSSTGKPSIYRCIHCNREGCVCCSDMKIHLKSHHGLKPFRCTVCHRTFDHLASLGDHSLKFHGIGYSKKKSQ